MGAFSNRIAALNKEYSLRLEVTAQTAVKETVDDAQTTHDEGGRMKFDTGFLRGSIQAAIGRMPSGPTENEGGKKYRKGAQVAGEDVDVTLLRWDPNKGETLFVGWTANYARPREFRDGFLRGAVEKWPQTVERVAKKVRQRI